MAFQNRKAGGGVTTSQVITLIQSYVKAQQTMVGNADGVNLIFTVPNGDSVFNNMIDVFVGGGKLTPTADYTVNSPTQITLTNPPTTSPECTYIKQ